MPGAPPDDDAAQFDLVVLRRYSRVLRVCAVVLASIGVGVLVGWTWQAHWLIAVLPGTAAMRPNTAVCLVVLGVVLWCDHEGTGWGRRSADAGAALVVLIAAATLAEYVTGADLGLDRVLFGADPALAGQPYPGRMAPQTAAGLLLIGVALLVPAQARQVLALAAGAIGVLGLYGYAYQVPEFQTPFDVIAMALNTAVGLTVAALATFVARPTAGPARALTTRARSAMMTRRILLATLLVPPALGWLRLLGQHHGVYGTELGVTMLVAANVAVLVAVTFVTGNSAVKLEVARRRAEAELAWHSAAAAVAESAPDAMVGVDTDGTVVLVNAQAERLFGRPRGDMLGRPLDLLVPEAARAARNAALPSRPRLHRLGVDMVTVRRPDGGAVPAEISLSTLDTGGRRLVVAALHDVTRRARYEEQLRDKNAQLQQANQAKDAFLGAMSHELRTPLNAVIGFTGTLLMGLSGPLNEQQAHQLRLVEAASQHLLALINDVLDFAKIEAGQLEVHPEPVDCAAAVAEVTDFMRPLAEQKGIALVTDLPGGGCVAAVDRRAFGQILINLVDNGIKFTAYGEVRVSLTRDESGGPWILSVRDTGPGIDPAEHAHIFKAFHRTADARGRDGAGAGLGLYISHTLADLMACPLELTSEPGKGSTFTLALKPAP